MPEESHGTPPTVGAVHRTPEGMVTPYECKYRELGMHMTAVFTREEYVVNERIVERASMGVVFTFSVEPDATGTTVTTTWDSTTLDKVLDAIWFHGDKRIEEAHATIKHARWDLALTLASSRPL